MSDETDAQQAVLRKALEGVGGEIRELDAQANTLRSKRSTLMFEARQAGMTYPDIAKALQVTKAYVHQTISRRLKNA